ncbi:PLP-dependent cysteine synthase family protein [Saccharopolyspora gregorii]|uniref:PLP-dependent cysteine synthase family protein n=1 Tax=Saccharopolyspora gregorii TaxID=33914 RepID=A0ABP6RR57_9PSEU|nr:PLP-dependent cysteine synthase family protein [Saccharopolyspora gregorii]
MTGRAPARCDSALDLIGGTPLLRVAAPIAFPHPGFWAKLESTAPGGMKARAAHAMLTGARARGELRPGGTVVESTSGTLGIGLAYVGTALGHPVVVVADAELDGQTRALLTAHGVRVELVRDPHPVGGWQRARLDRVRELLAELPGAYWPDQYNNPDNVTGYRALGHELLDQLPDAQVVVCSVGTGGHSAGIARALRERAPGVRLVGVDAAGSAVFGDPVAKRLMRGLGSSIHPGNVDYAAFDEVHLVGAAESVAACHRLAAGAFVTGGWSTGAVALVASWCARELGADQVAAVFPDGPHRYWGTIYDPDFLAAQDFPEPAAEPVDADGIPSEVDSRTTWRRSRKVVDPCARRADGPAECPVCEVRP